MEERILEKLRKEQKEEQKKQMKKFLVAIISTAVVFGTIGVAAGSYTAKQIIYRPSDTTWKVSNVSDAIDSIKYNKTSDNYSTEEKVVGTWIDGKPLYQKTIEFNKSDSSNSWVTITSLGSNVNVKNIFGSYINIENGRIWMLSDFNEQNGIVINFPNEGDISLRNSNGKTFKGNVTIQYTKTNDNSSS